MTAAFALVTGTLEGMLVARALAMASATGMNLQDVAASIRSGGLTKGDEEESSESRAGMVGGDAAEILAEAIVSRPRAGGQGLLW